MKTGKPPRLTFYIFLIPFLLTATLSANHASAGQAPIVGTWVAKNPPQFGGEIIAITMQINPDGTILETAETENEKLTQKYNYTIQGQFLFILQAEMEFSKEDAIGMPFSINGNKLSVAMDGEEPPIAFTRIGQSPGKKEPPVPAKTTGTPPAPSSDLTGRWTSVNLKDDRSLTLDFIDAKTLNLITVKSGKTQNRQGTFTIKENILVLRSPKGREIEFPFNRRGDRIRMIFENEKIELRLEAGDDNDSSR